MTSTISIGSLVASLVHPREVFRRAIQHAAAGVLVVHNHPSGDPQPSPEDWAVTDRLREAGQILGIELVDHVGAHHHAGSTAKRSVINRLVHIFGKAADIHNIQGPRALLKRLTA